MRICLESDNFFEEFTSFGDYARICEHYSVSRDEQNSGYGESRMDTLAQFACKFGAKTASEHMFGFFVAENAELFMIDLLKLPNGQMIDFVGHLLNNYKASDESGKMELIRHFKGEMLPIIFKIAEHNEKIYDEVRIKLEIAPIKNFLEFWAKDRAKIYGKVFWELEFEDEKCQKMYKELLESFYEKVGFSEKVAD